MRCNLHAIHSVLLKCTVQWSLINLQNCAAITIQFKNIFLIPETFLVPICSPLNMFFTFKLIEELESIRIKQNFPGRSKEQPSYVTRTKHIFPYSFAGVRHPKARLQSRVHSDALTCLPHSDIIRRRAPGLSELLLSKWIILSRLQYSRRCVVYTDDGFPWFSSSFAKAEATYPTCLACCYKDKHTFVFLNY